MVVTVITCTIINILMIRKIERNKNSNYKCNYFFSVMKERCVLLQAQVIVFYMQVSPISRAIFPLRPHFITGECRVILTIISIIIVIIIIIIITTVISIIIIVIINAIAIAPNILFCTDRSIVTITEVYMVDKFVKPSRTNFS